MIVLIGDVHGEFDILKELVNKVPEDAKILQVGDFGFWPYLAEKWYHTAIARHIYFIDGNHDYLPGLPADQNKIYEVWPHLHYVPRGHVLNWDDKQILCIGGAKSLDRAWRPFNSSQGGWFEEEQISDLEANQAVANAIDAGGIHFMVTHTPPDTFIRANFNDQLLREFGHRPEKWINESGLQIDKVWNALGNPPLYCGHMHTSIRSPKIQVLDCNEVMVL